MMDNESERAVQLELFPVTFEELEFLSQTAKVSELREERHVWDGAAAAGKSFVYPTPSGVWWNESWPLADGLGERKEVKNESSQS